MLGRISVAVLALTLARAGEVVAAPACPEKAVLAERVHAIDRSGLSRISRWNFESPDALYEQAIGEVGRPFTDRAGDRGFAVMIAEVPVEALWKAISDEEHHALREDFIPVRHSEIVGGVPRGRSRLLFQYFKQMGVGRWWVSRVTMNSELYESSGGRIWEVWWKDEMDAVDTSKFPLDRVSADLTPIKSSRGAWALIDIDESCTAIEHFSWSEAGGFAGVAQPLMIRRALRATLEGLVRMAREHVDEPHPGPPFLRPDGTTLP